MNPLSLILSCVLPYTNAEWEKRSIFLNFLISKLPAPAEEDLSKGILDAIDMDSYRVEKRAVQQILLADENAEVAPVPPDGGGRVPQPELERLSTILREFNDLFGAIEWNDADRVTQMITETIPSRVAQDAAFRNARQNSDDENAGIEHDDALTRVMTGLMKDDSQLFKQFMDNDGFKRWMTDTVFALASGSSAESVGRIEVLLKEVWVGWGRSAGRRDKALAALGARLPRTVGPGRQPAARVLRCAAVLRMTAATDRAGGPCGPAGRLALDRLAASATAERRSVVAEDRRKRPRTWLARFRAAQAVADARGFLFALGFRKPTNKAEGPHASDHGSVGSHACARRRQGALLRSDPAARG